MIPNMKKVEKQFGVEIYHHLEAGMKVRSYHTNLDGCGYIVSRAETQEKAVEKAEKVFNYLKKIIFRREE